MSINQEETSKKLLVIGAGNMGRALLTPLLSSDQKVLAKEIVIVDPNFAEPHSVSSAFISNKDNREITIQTHTDLSQCTGSFDTIILTIKPQLANSVIPLLSHYTHEGTTLISAMAGITCARIYELLATSGVNIIRAMPNIAMQYDNGITTLYFPTGSSSQAADTARSIFTSGGSILEVTQEHLIDAATAISGSGPGFFFHLLEGVYHEVLALGFNAEQAKQLIHGTLKGTALLYEHAEVSLAELEAQVTSPQGTTAAGVEVLKRGEAQSVIRSCLRRAMERSIELGKDL